MIMEDAPYLAEGEPIRANIRPSLIDAARHLYAAIKEHRKHEEDPEMAASQESQDLMKQYMIEAFAIIKSFLPEFEEEEDDD